MLKRAKSDVPGANVGNRKTSGEEEPRVPERLRAASVRTIRRISRGAERRSKMP